MLFRRSPRFTPEVLVPRQSGFGSGKRTLVLADGCSWVLTEWVGGRNFCFHINCVHLGGRPIGELLTQSRVRQDKLAEDRRCKSFTG